MKRYYKDDAKNIRYEKKDELISFLNLEMDKKAEKKSFWKSALSTRLLAAAACFVLAFSAILFAFILPNNNLPVDDSGKNKVENALMLESIAVTPSITLNGDSAYDCAYNSQYYIFQMSADLSKINFTENAPVLYVEKTVDGVTYSRQFNFDKNVSQALSRTTFDGNGTNEKVTVYLVFVVERTIYNDFTSGDNNTSIWGNESESLGTAITIVFPAGTVSENEFKVGSSFDGVTYIENKTY